MNSIRRKKLVMVLVLCALALSTIGAVPSSAETSQELYNEKWVAGALSGSTGGSFNYYKIEYPGNKSVVTIELRFAPADPVTRTAFGFNVYGPSGFFIGRGLWIKEELGDGVLQLQYADENKATWLVQVFNYLPKGNVNYGIMAKGIPATGPQPTPVPVPVKPTPPSGSPVPLIGSGYVTGRSGGNYTFYKVTVPVGGPDVQLLLTVWPDDANIATGVGFVVYGPSGGEAARGATTATPGERRATLSTKYPGVYEVQVYNYFQGLTISYILRNTAGK